MTAVSGLLGRGQKLWSEKMGGGKEKADPADAEGARGASPTPGTGVPGIMGERMGGVGLRESLYRKSLAHWGPGRLEKLKPQSRCPAIRGRDVLSPRPHTHTGRIRPSCGWGWGRP